MTGICGACTMYAHGLYDIEEGSCELHEKEVGFSDDFCCDDFSLDDNIAAFLIKQVEDGNLKPGIIYFDVEERCKG